MDDAVKSVYHVWHLLESAEKTYFYLEIDEQHRNERRIWVN